jgi:hypothetical protein
LVVGAPVAADMAGRVCLFLGADLAAGTYDLGDASRSWSGEAAGDFAGSGGGAAGDLDGDGQQDLRVGAPYNDQGGDSAGKGYLLTLGPGS